MRGGQGRGDAAFWFLRISNSVNVHERANGGCLEGRGGGAKSRRDDWGQRTVGTGQEEEERAIYDTNRSSSDARPT